ncbi:immunoglobulin superfamily member 6 [Anolis carolinensis]|uniref:immunoglobulin superfamily member 6 n=1 Tax=Anolis carolinensis TaxID=28377 RepID=UPI002F2B7BE7
MITSTRWVLILEFTWLSYCAGNQCTVSVRQPQSLEGFTESSNITILCTFSAQKCPMSSLNILWFRYLAKTHEDLCTPECKNRDKFEVLRPADNHTLLQINMLSADDSGIYYCGIAFPDSKAPTSKTTGEGTLLVIRETKIYSKGAINIMVTISLLLFLYITAILAILKFFSKPKFKKSENEDLRGKQNVHAKETRDACQAIAKEIYKKKKRKQWPGHLANFGKRHVPS